MRTSERKIVPVTVRMGALTHVRLTDMARTKGVTLNDLMLSLLDPNKDRAQKSQEKATRLYVYDCDRGQAPCMPRL
jgi:hypothetical protein